MMSFDNKKSGSLLLLLAPAFEGRRKYPSRSNKQLKTPRRKYIKPSHAAHRGMELA